MSNEYLGLILLGSLLAGIFIGFPIAFTLIVLAVVFVIGCLINGPGPGRYGGGRVRVSLALAAEDRRLYGTIAAGAFVVLVAICFWVYYPLYVGDLIPYQDWWRRMLLGNRWV